MSKKFLVTGAAGFIGSHLVDYLLKHDHEVLAIDNFNNFYDPEIKRSNVKEHLEHPKYKLYEGDLCDYQFVESVFKENRAHETGAITHIVHLAAMAGVRPSIQNPILYNHVNNGSTINLFDLAVKYGSSLGTGTVDTSDPEEHGLQKFIFASSSSVYGEANSVPFKEDADISKPLSPYAATKVAGEAMAFTMSNLYKIPTVCLRFFTVYGPRQRPDLAIHKFTKLIDEDKEIQVYGDGSAKRDFTYIDDIIDGIVKAIDYDCAFDIFNLGESQTMDVNTLVGLLEKKLNKKAKVHYMPPIPGDMPITYADISKTREKLGYSPCTLVDEGLDKFLNWYHENKKAMV